MTQEKKDRLGNIVVGGFLLALVAGLLSGIPGLEWLVIVAVSGILPFCAVAAMAFFHALAGMLRS